MHSERETWSRRHEQTWDLNDADGGQVYCCQSTAGLSSFQTADLAIFRVNRGREKHPESSCWAATPCPCQRSEENRQTGWSWWEDSSPCNDPSSQLRLQQRMCELTTSLVLKQMVHSSRPHDVLLQPHTHTTVVMKLQLHSTMRLNDLRSPLGWRWQDVTLYAH